MPDSTSELLIRIKTILQSEGADAARAQIDQLISKTKVAQAANAGAEAQNKASKQGVDELGTSNQELVRGLQDLRSALDGNIFAFARFGAGAGSSIAALGQLGLVAAAFTAGWKLGEKINELADFLTNAGKAATGLEAPLERDRAAFEKLSQVKLNTLKQEISDLGSSIAALSSQWEKLNALAAAERDAGAGAAIAKLKTEHGETPETAQVALNIRKKSAEEALRSEQAAAADQAQLAKENKRAAEAKLSALRAEAAEAESAHRAAVSVSGKEAQTPHPVPGIAGMRQDLATTAAREAREDAEKARERLKAAQPDLEKQAAEADQQKAAAESRARVAQANYERAMAEVQLEQQKLDREAAEREAAAPRETLPGSRAGAVREMQRSIVGPRLGDKIALDEAVREAAQAIAGGAGEATTYQALIARIKQLGGIIQMREARFQQLFDALDNEVGTLQSQLAAQRSDK